jgi:sporulation protein YlmC with PRC-barrel domain
VIFMAKEAKDKKALTKDRLVGMQVIDGEGNGIGTVQDIAFTVGKIGMTLILETKKGETREILWEDIQAAGEYVILKPQSSHTQSMLQQPQDGQRPVCQICGEPLTFVNEYQRWYCYKDKKYA